MAGCTCSELPVSRTLSVRSDFLRLAQCSRRFALFRSGRVSVAVPCIDAGRRRALEDSINRYWQACGCAEASMAMMALLPLWFFGIHPFDAWRQQASGMLAGLACFAFVAVGVTVVKVASIALAQRRLARLLEREADAIFGGETRQSPG